MDEGRGTLKEIPSRDQAEAQNGRRPLRRQRGRRRMAAKKTRRPVVVGDVYEDKTTRSRQLRVTKVDGEHALCEVVGPHKGKGDPRIKNGWLCRARSSHGLPRAPPSRTRADGQRSSQGSPPLRSKLDPRFTPASVPIPLAKIFGVESEFIRHLVGVAPPRGRWPLRFPCTEDRRSRSSPGSGQARRSGTTSSEPPRLFEAARPELGAPGFLR